MCLYVGIHSFIHSVYVYYSASALRHIVIFTFTSCIYHYNEKQIDGSGLHGRGLTL